MKKLIIKIALLVISVFALSLSLSYLIMIENDINYIWWQRGLVMAVLLLSIVGIIASLLILIDGVER